MKKLYLAVSSLIGAICLSLGMQWCAKHTPLAYEVFYVTAKSDAEIIYVFRSERVTLATLSHMVKSDGSINGLQIDQSTQLADLLEDRFKIDATRLENYKSLLNRLGPEVRLEVRDGNIFLVYSSADATLSIASELEKGLMYSPLNDEKTLGIREESLDNLNRFRGVDTEPVLRPLGSNWYIYYSDF